MSSKAMKKKESKERVASAVRTIPEYEYFRFTLVFLAIICPINGEITKQIYRGSTAGNAETIYFSAEHSYVWYFLFLEDSFFLKILFYLDFVGARCCNQLEVSRYGCIKI